ncbi:hypothetical protein [Hydrogenimonas sp. SS33]|uniref:hypothetical protein n=1 Tax=Hydrogenimonas leucolamina TaxID=2954236 RepID=UPI00336BCF24
MGQIRRYVSTKKDSRTIAQLQEALKREETRYEAARQANRHYDIAIRGCKNGAGSAIMCTLYVDGRYDGNIFYKSRSDGNDGFDIFILGSKHAGASMGGYYDTSLHRVWTTKCGDSVFGASPRIMVYSISDALMMYAECAVNGKYK